jgi:hypothetical protein
MYKFAHTGDWHFGALRDPVLQRLQFLAFEKFIEKCREEGVDFIIISGDLFHSNLPDMEIVNKVVKNLKELKDRSIPVYVIYGSHDYSPNQTSIIDILDSAGLFTNISKGRVEGGKLNIDFVTDPKTKAKLAGIPARKMGLESKSYEILDKRKLEKEEGFKIFVFHSAIKELILASFYPQMPSIPISHLPKNFDYYAGGHLHQRIEGKKPGYERIVYPGPLFGANPKDFELGAKGEKRGFYIVSFENKVERADFVEISVCNYCFSEYDASNKDSTKVQEELVEKAMGLPAANKLTLMRIKGELSAGRTSDINFSQIRKILLEKGATHVYLNHYSLTSREFESLKVAGEEIGEIENKLLRESIKNIKVSIEALEGEMGASLAIELLKVLRQIQKPNEKNADYEDRIAREGFEVLKLERVMK